MPEGDTVWRAARLLDRALGGHVLTDSEFRVPKLAVANLTGGIVRQTVSRGKHLLTHIDTQSPNGPDAPMTRWTLHTHLKMEGAWQVYSPGQKWRRPSHQARVILQAGDHVAVGFSLGIVELIARDEEASVVGHLGPDLLGVDWDEGVALTRLLADPTRRIHEALLDQRVLAGIGNMYAAELCFLHGIHPELPVESVPDATRLLRRAKQVLDANKDRAIQCTTGDLRVGCRTWVYARENQPCLRCATTIRVTMLGDPGRERAAYWCPNCQPG
jgi:endonuclease VIII